MKKPANTWKPISNFVAKVLEKPSVPAFVESPKEASTRLSYMEYSSSEDPLAFALELERKKLEKSLPLTLRSDGLEIKKVVKGKPVIKKEAEDVSVENFPVISVRRQADMLVGNEFDNYRNLKSELATIEGTNWSIAQNNRRIMEAFQSNNQLTTELQARIQRLQIFVDEIKPK